MTFRPAPEILADHLANISSQHGIHRLFFVKHSSGRMDDDTDSASFGETVTESCTLLMGHSSLKELRDKISEYIEEIEVKLKTSDEDD